MTFPELCRVLRVALTGRTTGPDIFKVMEVLGKERCLKRLHEARFKLYLGQYIKEYKEYLKHYAS